MFLLIFISGVVNAQEGGQSTPDRNRAAQYFLGGGVREQVLMAVNVWGFVVKPGQYMVPYNTDLISLLSYAGGPREEAKIKSIKIVRTSEKAGRKVITVDVNEFLKTAETNIPVLLPGDTVVVSGTTFHFIRQLFDFTWRVATVLQVYFLAQWYSRNS